MRKWKWKRIAFIAALLSGCASVGQVRTDFDEKAEFKKFKTYAFVEPKEIEKTGVLSNTIIRERVEGLLRENLDAEGLKFVPLEQNPDLVVQYWLGVKDKQDIAHIQSIPSSYGPYYNDHWGTSYDRFVSYDYREGTLIVDLIDRETKDLAWRAYLVQVLEDNKDTNMKTARNSLKKAFADYPPKPK